MTDSISLSTVALDCPDATELARFYAEITGGRVTFADESWATVRCPGGRIDFQSAADYRAPTWPSGDNPIQLHLDFDVDDLTVTEARVLACGAITSTTLSPTSTAGSTPTRPAIRSVCPLRMCRSRTDVAAQRRAR